MCMESEVVVDTSLEMQVTNVEYDIAKSCRERVIATFGTSGTNVTETALPLYEANPKDDRTLFQ